MDTASAALLAIPFLIACSAASPGQPALDSVDSAQAVQVNGGNTGAMVRDVTPAGYTCIDSSITLPDYNPDPSIPSAQAGEPWIYYGFSDSFGDSDMECGLAFQAGNPSLGLVHRWRPYFKAAGGYYFAPEDPNTVYPGQTVALECTLSGGVVTMRENGAPVSFYGGGNNQAHPSFPLGLSPSAAHVRRVVGNAWDVKTLGAYHGQRMGTVGPVTYQNTRVCQGNTVVSFRGSVASWQQSSSGFVYGTAHVPGAHVTETHSGSVDVVTLFPEAPMDAGAEAADVRAADAQVDAQADGPDPYYCADHGYPDGYYCGNQIGLIPNYAYECSNGFLAAVFGACSACPGGTPPTSCY
jgi:hypothetical protein